MNIDTQEFASSSCDPWLSTTGKQSLKRDSTRHQHPARRGIFFLHAVSHKDPQ
jgi:hypothetical protein